MQAAEKALAFLVQHPEFIQKPASTNTTPTNNSLVTGTTLSCDLNKKEIVLGRKLNGTNEIE